MVLVFSCVAIGASTQMTAMPCAAMRVLWGVLWQAAGCLEGARMDHAMHPDADAVYRAKPSDPKQRMW